MSYQLGSSELQSRSVIAVSQSFGNPFNSKEMSRVTQVFCQPR